MVIKVEEIGRVAIRAYQTSNEGESHFDLMVGVNSEPLVPGGVLVEQVLARDIVVTEQQNTDVRHDASKTVVASKMIVYEQVEKAAKGRMATSTGSLTTAISTPSKEANAEGPKDKVDYLKNMIDQLDNAVQGDRVSQNATNNELHAVDKKLSMIAGLAAGIAFIGAIIGIVALYLSK